MARKQTRRQTSSVSYNCPFGDYNGARSKVALLGHTRAKHGLSSWADVEEAYSTVVPSLGNSVPDAVSAQTSSDGSLTDPLTACLTAAYPNGIWPEEYDSVSTFVRGVMEAVSAHGEFAE